MKIGIRKPSLKKSFKARTTGRAKRAVKKALIPGYGKKGMGWIKNPKKALYNKVYNKTSFSVVPKGLKSPGHRSEKSNAGAGGSTSSNGTTWLWILGWLVFFPVPLTIVIVRSEMKSWIKVCLVAPLWLLILLIAAVNGTDDSGITAETVMEDFVSDYNSVSDHPLDFVSDFDVSDRSGEHYRTDFRTGSFKDAYGCSYKAGDQTVDIVSFKRPGRSGTGIRIYADKVNMELCSEIIRNASPILDGSLSEDEIDALFEKLETYHFTYACSYGTLHLSVHGSDSGGFSLEIKTD